MKSSILLFLLQLLDPVPSCEESITIDDIPLCQIHRSTLRQLIIAVPQGPIFLPDGTSIRENLDPQGESTEAQCLSVLELVNLRTLVEERGGVSRSLAADSLSQGQKQFFSLARASLRHRAQVRA